MPYRRYLTVMCMLLFRYMSADPSRLIAAARPHSAAPAVPPPISRTQAAGRQKVLVPTLLVMVVVLDQAAKWWAWRHFPWTTINSGGDRLVGPTIGEWYAGPVTGALLDLLDVGLLSIAVWVLARCRATAPVVVPGALMTGGWASNLLDRLGFHYWTAPGSVRGAVDFIHLGTNFYNIADFFIIGCTPLFLLAAGYQAVRAVGRPAAAASAWPPAGRRATVRVPALAGAGLILVAALGAVNYHGVSAPPHPPARRATGANAAACYPLASRSARLGLTVQWSGRGAATRWRSRCGW
jgi:lipoprotein signal peptidase